MTQTKAAPSGAWDEPKPTALLVLADGTVLEGQGLGAVGHAVGEVCFNTAMTGYEEILTDPSYAGQIITFTFPHIGNVGANEEDIESLNMAATPGARHRRTGRQRHPRADRADPRKGHAECRDRACGRRQVRYRRAEEGSSRLAGPRRHGPGADGDLGAASR